MGGKSLKFVILGSMIIAVVSFLAFTTFEESKSYYMNVDEVKQIGQKAIGMSLKVRGMVDKGSIKRDGKKLAFSMGLNGQSIHVNYVGDAIIPDNFKDNTEVIVNGTMTDASSFEARRIQAKCASKYKADYSKLKRKNTL